MSLCCVCKLRKSPGDRVKSRGGLGELDKATIAPGEKQHFDPNFPDETDPVSTVFSTINSRFKLCLFKL